MTTLSADVRLPRLRGVSAAGAAPPGMLTWATAAGCAAALTAASLGQSVRLSLITIAATLVLGAFLLRPLWGLALVVAVRPGLDRWSNTSLLSVKGHTAVNPGSLVAIFIIAVGVAYLLENWQVARRVPSARAFGVLLALAVISIPLSGAKTVGIEEILRLTAIIVLYGLAFVCVRSTRDLGLLAAALICSGLIPAGVALYQAAHSQLPVHAGFPRVRGLLATFDALGILMALVITFAIPLAVSRTGRLRLLSCVALPVLLAALLASYGRTGWLGATVGLLIVGAVRQKWLIVAVPVLIVAVAVALPSTTSRVLELRGSQHNTFSGRVHHVDPGVAGRRAPARDR